MLIINAPSAVVSPPASARRSLSNRLAPAWSSVYLESPKLNQPITTFSEAGNSTVEKKYPIYKDGRVYINDIQFFGNVPEVAWNFYIGGYQPAQKWLKDRQGRKLTNQDIEHYQKMIMVLVETGKIMREIDKIQ
jgi:hypothetical protein